MIQRDGYKEMNDLGILEFICIALDNPFPTNTLQALVKYTCQYGSYFKVTPEDVNKVLNKKFLKKQLSSFKLLLSAEKTNNNHKKMYFIRRIKNLNELLKIIKKVT